MVNGIDSGNNKDAYFNMGDEELLIFAKEEGTKLTTNGYRILKEELSRRQIGLERKKFEEDLHKDLFISSIEYAMDEKKNEKSQYEIYAGLIERGINEPYANYMINKLGEWAEILHRDAATDLQAGIAILVLGLGILYLTIKIERFEVGAGIIILIGIVKIISSLDKKKKYKKIVDRFSIEDN